MELKHAKLNKKVSFVRRNGATAEGVICAEPEHLKNGIWVKVNTGDKKNPDITSVRLGNLSAR